MVRHMCGRDHDMAAVCASGSCQAFAALQARDNAIGTVSNVVTKQPAARSCRIGCSGLTWTLGLVLDQMRGVRVVQPPSKAHQQTVNEKLKTQSPSPCCWSVLEIAARYDHALNGSKSSDSVTIVWLTAP